MEALKVSAKSIPNSVAGALTGCIRENGRAEIKAVGAGAVNQAVKAVAIARGFLAPAGIDLICIPAFGNVEFDGEEKNCHCSYRRTEKIRRKVKNGRDLENAASGDPEQG